MKKSIDRWIRNIKNIPSLMPKMSLSLSNHHVMLERCSAEPINAQPQTSEPLCFLLDRLFKSGLSHESENLPLFSPARPPPLLVGRRWTPVRNKKNRTRRTFSRSKINFDSTHTVTSTALMGSDWVKNPMFSDMRHLMCHNPGSHRDCEHESRFLKFFF